MKKLCDTPFAVTWEFKPLAPDFHRGDVVMSNQAVIDKYEWRIK